MSKKILIIGNSAKVYALAKKLSETNEVFVAPGNQTIQEFATCIDIREDSVSELLEYVMEYGIDFTIPISDKSIRANIAEVFYQNNLQIFAPSSQAAKITYDKAYMKKCMYKLRIPTPKFGIFEKNNMALDYVKKTKPPFVVKTNEQSSAVICTSALSAKNLIDIAFLQKNQKVVIEDYVWGTPFSFYVVTDGYKALPIGSSILYKHSLEGDGGQLTTGMGACVPNYKLSLDNEYYLMDNVIYPLLENLEREGTPYTGLLGIDAILTEDNSIQVLGFQSFTQDCDTDAIFSLLDIDILSFMEACVIGSFSDEFDFIPQKDYFATTLVLQCKNKENVENVIAGLEQLDENILKTFYPAVSKNRYLEYEVEYGSTIAITAFGRTITSASANVYENVKSINFKGIHYRKDICKTSIS